MNTHFLEQYELGPMQNQIYLLADPSTQQAYLVDPAWDIPFLLKKIETYGFHLMGVLLTHGHPDHTNGIPELIKIYPTLPIYVSKHEAAILKPKVSTLIEVLDQEIIMLGNLEITCIFTPGHSPGGQCFWIDDILLTGDSLFINGCGRVDLPGSNADHLFESLQKIGKLPDHTVIYPGHRYHPKTSDTLGNQKLSNRYLSQRR